MVVLEDGLAKRSDYRRFTVKSVPGNDDYAAMEEVLTRRLTALKEAPAVAEGGRPRRFAYRPNLLLVDGGKGQLHVAERVVRELGLDGEIELAALAKQFEEVYRPGSPDPVRLRAARTRSTCCSGCATRRTASPSPSTGSGGPSG